MFNAAVKYFGFLKQVPLLPHVFDALLKTAKLISGSRVPFYIDDIEQEVLKWEGTCTRLHKYGGLQFDFRGRELGHIHGNGLLDVLFSREVKRALMAGGRTGEHHVFRNSGWTSFYVRTQEDRDRAIRLLRISYRQKAAAAAGKNIPRPSQAS